MQFQCFVRRTAGLVCRAMEIVQVMKMSRKADNNRGVSHHPTNGYRKQSKWNSETVLKYLSYERTFW